MLELPGEKKRSPLPKVLFVLMAVILVGAVWYFAGGDEEAIEEAVEENQQVFVPSEPEFLSLLPAEAYQLVEERKAVIVDVRSEAERAEVIIPGSISVPLAKLAAGEFDLPKEQALLLVCSVGGRSYGAGLYLMQQGYLQVYNLRGGINAWSREGLPLVTNSATGESEVGEKEQPSDN